MVKGSDVDSELSWPVFASEVPSQSASGNETASFLSFAPASASEVALSEVMVSNRTFIRFFRRSEPGVESQPPGSAGVRMGSVPALERRRAS
jgi:hypothetical protein